ncbi:MAG: hypothetical protein ABSB35_31425 [Bryobacteraceae bacterium]|jgi:hypothetical protein
MTHRGLVLYKRHNSTCSVNRSKIPLAKRRFWMDCDRQIWIVGRMPSGDLVPRQPTGCTDIKQVEAVRAAHIAHSVKGAKAGAVHGPTIAECAEKYLASRRHELGDTTIGQHKLFLDRLNKFCESINAVYMRDLSVNLLETFKTEGSPRTWRTRRRRLLSRSFAASYVLRTAATGSRNPGGQGDLVPGGVRTEGTLLG